jgi:hypothetical protein
MELLPAQNAAVFTIFQNMEKISHLEQIGKKRLRKVRKGVLFLSSPLLETNPFNK